MNRVVQVLRLVNRRLTAKHKRAAQVISITADVVFVGVLLNECIGYAWAQELHAWIDLHCVSWHIVEAHVSHAVKSHI